MRRNGASPSAASKVKNWRVAEELESVSDHRYIIIRLLPGGREANHNKGERQRGRIPTTRDGR